MTKLSSIFTVLVLLVAIRVLSQTTSPGLGDNRSPGPGARIIPFSADSIYESDNNALDGRPYHHEVRARVFRDSEGRFRRENLSGLGPVDLPSPTSIEIDDPVQRVSITLHPHNKTATIRHVGSIQKEKPAAPAPAPSAVRNSGAENRQANDEPDFGPHVGTMTVDKNGNVIYQGPSKPEQLGSREIEGFTVTGTRNSWIAPAGAFGNDRPFTLSVEVWYSTDLKIELLTKSENPRATWVQKLVNIQAVDQDPLLFQVPSGYTVKEEPVR